MQIQTLDNDARKKLRVVYLGNASIRGTLVCKTGLHIGSGNDDLKIGGIDKFVIKTPDNKPYIPGSSFKGKTRSLLEKWMGKPSNRGSDKIFRYEAENIDKALTCELSRIFGSTSPSGDALNFPSRLIVRDFMPIRDVKLERKSENTLDRLSAHANPRTNERVADGSEFSLNLEYNLEVIRDDDAKIYLGDNKDTIDAYLGNTIEDLKNIFNTLLLLEHSYLGGNGSRGYGHVSFTNLKLEIKTAHQLLGLDSKIVKQIDQSTAIGMRQDITTHWPIISEQLKAYYETLPK